MTAVDYGHRPSFRQVPRPQPDRSIPSLFDEQIPDDSIEGRFRAFHEANPLVYSELVRLTRQAVAAGRRPTVKKLWEDLRESLPLAADGRRYKLDNCHTALYARLIMEQEADLAGVFRLRDRRSK